MSNHDRGYHFGIREIDGLDPRLCDWECYLVPLIRWKSRQRSVYYEKKRIRESDDWWKEAKQRQIKSAGTTYTAYRYEV
jgi:pyruvate formate-lyase activating enzyme-like uncharacterized protein